jgi:hypothetical protein
MTLIRVRRVHILRGAAYDDGEFDFLIDLRRHRVIDHYIARRPDEAACRLPEEDRSCRRFGPISFAASSTCSR